MDEFEVPQKVAALLRNFPRPWWVAGGWAIDLYLDHPSRPHKDLEIAILRIDQSTLQRYLRGWAFAKILPHRGRMEPWQDGEWLAPPIHEVRARRDTGNPSGLEILLDESVGEIWQFRRNSTIVRPLSMVGLTTASGVPYLSPEIVLLYKAKGPSINDEGDFVNIRDALDPERRQWLKAAIETCYPGHPWRSQL